MSLQMAKMPLLWLNCHTQLYIVSNTATVLWIQSAFFCLCMALPYGEYFTKPPSLPNSDYTAYLFSMLCTTVNILEEIEMKIYLGGKEAKPRFAQAHSIIIISSSHCKDCSHAKLRKF